MTGEEPYAVLGVPRDAAPDDIKTAFRRLAMKHHPDRVGGDPARFQIIKEAYEILSDPARREKLDAGFESGGTIQAATLEYINLTIKYPDKNGICSTCGGKKFVKVALGKIAYITKPCPKCGDHSKKETP